MNNTKRFELFAEWKQLGIKIESLSAFVQNGDIEIPEHEIQEFRACAYSCWLRLKELTGETLVHLRER